MSFVREIEMMMRVKLPKCFNKKSFLCFKQLIDNINMWIKVKQLDSLFIELLWMEMKICHPL